MKKSIRFVGLDVHAESIAVAVAEPGGEVRSLGTIPNSPDAIRRLVKKLGPEKQLRVCYEAGPTGYVLYWQLVRMGVHCDVVAPTLIPMKAGDRVKTDRRDAEKLARSYRAGDLTAVWVPDATHEALRDLVRAREAAKKDQLRARHRLAKFLLRQGRRPALKMKQWTYAYMEWVRKLEFDLPAQDATFLDYLREVDHAAERIARLEKALDAAIEAAPEQMRVVIQGLQALRGVAKLTAATIVAEVGSLSRFEHPRQLMGYSGAVPSEYSTGGPGRHKRGAITKTGNAHLRRVLVEAAWAYRYQARTSYPLRKRQEGLSPEVKEIAWKAQVRLCSRYRRLAARGKHHGQVVIAVGRELLGFIWAIAVRVEQEQATLRGRQQQAAA
jgi:transposase